MIEMIEYEPLFSGGAFSYSAVFCRLGNRKYSVFVFVDKNVPIMDKSA